MKKVVLFIIVVGLTGSLVMAQNFIPAGGSALPDGTINTTYIGTTLTFTVPATTDFNTSVFGDPLTLPGVPLPVPNPNSDVTADITNVTWSVVGLPSGLSATCNLIPCDYGPNAIGTISISGTPTESGVFSVDILSMTDGTYFFPTNGQQVSFEDQPELLDELNYALEITGQSPCTPPSVLFAGLNSNYTTSDNPIFLTGAPSGGQFFGEGINGNQFDPATAGVGTHGITYVYKDQNDCLGAYSLCTTVSLAVGNGDLQNRPIQLDFNLYPNPAKNFLTLESDHHSGTIICKILDSRGREMKRIVLMSDGVVKEKIDISSLSSGIYLMELRTDVTTKTKLFTVN